MYQHIVLFIQAYSKRSLLLVLSASLLIVSSCASKSTTSKSTIEEVVVYKNAAIYTVNPEQPWAEAMVIDNGVITFVGSNKDVAQYEAAASKTYDLNGKMIMPGFQDVHMHPLEAASQSTHFTLDINETNAEKYIPIIRQAALQNENANWIIGYGHDINTLLKATRNPVDILDEAVSDRPVVIMEQTSHSMWVNSKALELAGFSKDTPNPTGGIIMKNAVNGEPNGIMIDNAGNMVMDMAMAPTDETLKNDYEGLVFYSLPELAKHGITSFSDARSYWKRDHHKTWKKIESKNELTARVVLGLWAYPDADDDVQIAKLKSLYSNDPNSLLRINQVKLYVDGLVQNTTAAMFEPYEIDLLGIQGNRGLNYFTQQRIEKYINALEPSGFDFHMHGIGERGIHEALNAVEISSDKSGRHRITHIEVMQPNDYARFAALNVTADAQVAGEFSNPEHWSEVSGLIGSVRANNLIPIKSLNDAGARLTLSSDWDVSTFNPFIGIQNAIGRAPQDISLEDAIAAYTINAAYVLRQEDKVGSIEVGKEADIIVLDQNIFNIESVKIKQTKVLQTLLAGKEVFRDAGFQ